MPRIPNPFDKVFGKSNKTRRQSQDDPTPHPEHTKGRYEGTQSQKETIKIGGKTYIVRRVIRNVDPETGQGEEHIIIENMVGPGGIPLSPGEIAAYTYTGIATPSDLLVECYNPEDAHDLRLCCMKIDSRQTDLGFWLCLECKAENDELIRKHKRWWDLRDYDYC